jgi:hypothetical protein
MKMTFYAICDKHGRTYWTDSKRSGCESLLKEMKKINKKIKIVKFKGVYR